MNLMPAGWTLKGRYVLEDVVGQGSAGAVYCATDRVTSEMCAVKEVEVDSLDPVEAAETRELFVRESEILLQLSHPCFPLVLDCFSDQDRYYLVMEFIQGRTLESVVEKNGPCTEAWVLPVARDLAAGLQVLHTHHGGPIIFRDLKPGNVMITCDDRVVLVDFGIARRYRPGQTNDTHALGTPGFAAPEQYGLAQSTPRSDIYGLGATLYFALTGKDAGLPNETHAPLLSLAPACSAEMEALLERCLQADPLLRPASAQEVRQALDGISAGPGTPGVPLSRDPRFLPRWVAATYRPHGLHVTLAHSPVRLVGKALVPVFAILAILAAIMVPGFLRARDQAKLTGCKSNLKNLGTALQVYADDNGKSYPARIADLTPNYLGCIPSCPSAGSNTYSATYRTSAARDAYTVACQGEHHGGVNQGAGYPQYTSEQGLISQ